jgi:hypothetical protein
LFKIDDIFNLKIFIMLKKIEQIKGLKKLPKSAQNSLNGGRAAALTKWCDFVFNHCHNMYDGDDAYMNCMNAGSCGHEA